MYLETKVRLRSVSAIVLAVLVSTTLWAQQSQSEQGRHPSESANDLVRRAVQKELANPQHEERFMYRMRKVAPDKTETKEYIETDAGTVARLMAQNDQPLTDQVQKNEQHRLDTLIQNPKLQADRQRKQKEDEDRVTKMVGALADAFNYQYDGNEPGPYGEMIRLKFEPNPNFNPPSRELRVYQGMQGTMLVDEGTQHLIRLNAQLFRDVDFGWGILGRLYKGGHFEIEQSRVASDRWETTRMSLDFTGKELMFKSLRIKEEEVLSDFKPVQQGLSLAQGINMLRSYEPNKNVVAKQQQPVHGAQK